MVVVPTPPRTPAIPVRPFTNPLLLLRKLCSNGQRFNAAANCSRWEISAYQYQAVKMPALTPQYHSGRYTYRGIRQSIWFIVIHFA